MKKLVLFGLALFLGLAVVTQAQVKSAFSYKAPTRNLISIDPAPATQGSTVINPVSNRTKSASAVTVITCGTAANALGWGYGAGSYDHLWANNDLKTVGFIHRMGPGGSPPSLSGYLAMDHAANYGSTAADWTINYQIYAAILNSGGQYYADAARYPQGSLYNPAGNTDPTNSYFCYYAPAFCNTTAASWGGYTWGTGKWGTQSDSTKHLDWYAPPPYRDIQHGYVITALGKAFGVGNEYEYISSTNYTYYDNTYLHTGIWNAATHTFDYTASLIPLPQNLGQWPTMVKVAADPSGTHVWIAAITNNGQASPVFDSTLYPVFFHSSDGGNTWSSSIAVTLDGPNGIPAIRNYISDARLEQVYAPSTVPPREEIAYSTVFDGDLTVDKWGNPHFAVGVCLPAGGFSIAPPDGANSPKFDSTLATFDIFSTDQGVTWCARMMGVNKRFRLNVTSSGSPTSIDMRTNASRNVAGDKIFVSWQDTWAPSYTDNTAPDIFARGWDLVTNKLTNDAGKDAATNVTFLSDITQTAFCPDQADVVFTKPDGSSLIPLACEIIDGLNLDNPVTFKYVSDFSWASTPSVYSIAAAGPPWGSDCNFPVGINEPVAAANMTVSVYPNPVNGIATVKVTVPQSGKGTIQVTNLVGQTVMSITRNFDKDVNTFTLDASQLTAGVYFYTVKQGSQKATGKIIVE